MYFHLEAPWQKSFGPSLSHLKASQNILRTSFVQEAQNMERVSITMNVHIRSQQYIRIGDEVDTEEKSPLFTSSAADDGSNGVCHLSLRLNEEPP